MIAYGYVRVSSKDQNEDRQLIALHELGLSNKHIKDLVGTFIADIVLQLLSSVAENERTTIKQRQAEGIAANKAKGIRFGRPPKPLSENFHAIYQQWKQGSITGTAAAKACGMPLSTFRDQAQTYANTKLS